MTYLILKAMHVIGVITWFAGLFYIFRLYVYHVENQDKPEVVKILETMERRLFLAITTPAFIFTLIMGFATLWQNTGLLQTKWFLLKLVFVGLLVGYHFFCGYVRQEFLRKNYFLTSRQCRLINEIPTIVLLVAVPLAIIKPF